MDAMRVGVTGGILLGELADLRPGKALEWRGSRERRHRLTSAERDRDRGALRRRALVHPDWRFRARERRGQLSGERHCGIEVAPDRGRGLIEVDAAVLLCRAGYRGDRLQIDAPVIRNQRHHAVERVRPHHRRGRDLARA